MHACIDLAAHRFRNEQRRAFSRQIHFSQTKPHATPKASVVQFCCSVWQTKQRIVPTSAFSVGKNETVLERHLANASRRNLDARVQHQCTDSSVSLEHDLSSFISLVTKGTFCARPHSDIWSANHCSLPIRSANRHQSQRTSFTPTRFTFTDPALYTLMKLWSSNENTAILHNKNTKKFCENQSDDSVFLVCRRHVEQFTNSKRTIWLFCFNV